jgi:hypothetical protein
MWKIPCITRPDHLNSPAWWSAVPLFAYCQEPPESQFFLVVCFSSCSSLLEAGLGVARLCCSVPVSRRRPRGRATMRECGQGEHSGISPFSLSLRIRPFLTPSQLTSGHSDSLPTPSNGGQDRRGGNDRERTRKNDRQRICVRSGGLECVPIIPVQ